MTSERVKRAADDFFVWHGAPHEVFGVGETIVAAERAIVRELAEALRVDLREVHDVPIAALADDTATRPFRLEGLRAFLERHRAAFEATLDPARLVQNALAYADRRISFLRELGAPDVIVDNEVSERSRIASPGYVPRVDWKALVPDALGAASVVDVASRAASGEPCVVNVDLTDVVLVAAQAAVRADSLVNDVPNVESLVWTSLIERDGDDDDVPADIIRVGAAVYGDRLEALSYASNGAWLRVVLAAAD